MTVAIIIIIWLATGVFVYAVNFAYWQGNFPLIAEKDYRMDRWVSIMFGVWGPVELFVDLLFVLVVWVVSGQNLFRYGLKFK